MPSGRRGPGEIPRRARGRRRPVRAPRTTRRRGARARSAWRPGRRGARPAPAPGTPSRTPAWPPAPRASRRNGVLRPGRVRYCVQLSAMTDSATAAFDAHAADYDALRRRLVPCFDAFYGAAVRALDPVPAKRVLDLGAGTGALSLRIAEAFPHAELVLVDGSPAMLERASA